MRPNNPVDIIVPVYSGSEESLACLQSVFRSRPQLKTPTEIIVIFDAGPDRELREQLLQFASQGKITLLINDNNLGFVKCANKGMSHNSNHDVMLLNSDTVVANDWLDRMVSLAYSDLDIATVTPFSNNAEICSWPNICENNQLPTDTSVEKLDEYFSSFPSEMIEIPTAVGFCMFIKREVIERIGLFDAKTFGRGYGEENDFCQRALARNYTHALANNVFVHHIGGVSFAEEKNERVQDAIRILDKLYPSYHASVTRHLEEDPARKWRFAAELALKCDVPLILHISHGIGGGTDKHVVELAASTAANFQHAMLVPQAEKMRLVFPNVETGGLFEFVYEDLPELKRFLFSLSISRIHLHHVKGWEDHIETLMATLDLPYDVTLHDYYFIHPNPSLTDRFGKFCEDLQSRDKLCSEAVPVPGGLSPKQWRQKWSSTLNRAERVFVPSRAAARIYKKYFSELQFTYAFHPDWKGMGSYPEVAQRQLGEDEKLHVVVIGALSIIKGSEVLEKVSLLAAKNGAPLRFTLVGYANRKLANTVTTLGAYDDADLPGILASIKPDLLWFPCKWPETYSYTLSTVLKGSYPVVCPNIGAFPERLENRPYTWVEDWRIDEEQWLNRILSIRESFVLEQTAVNRQQWHSQPRTSFVYQNDYRKPAILPDRESRDWSQLMLNWEPKLPEERAMKGRFFRILIWLNSHSVFGHLANLIPLWVRRSVKRRLSTRPIHD